MLDRLRFDKVISNLKQLKSDLPRVLAHETTNFFIQENFDKQQFDGKEWAPVNRQGKYKNGKSTRLRSATLVQSGRLRRAVINSLSKLSWDEIVWRVSDVKYAKVHNEGLKAGRGAGFQMPKRQFIGDSKALRAMQLALVKKEVDKVWK